MLNSFQNLASNYTLKCDLQQPAYTTSSHVLFEAAYLTPLSKDFSEYQNYKNHF